MKTELTAVIFRTFKKEGSVIALFPLEPHDFYGVCCVSYQKIGQHGAASQGMVRDCTRPATRSEITPLKQELICIGYKLRELKRFPSNAYQIRKGKVGK